MLMTAVPPRTAPALAVVRGPQALADCLPAASDPDYLWVLTELVRADLEHHWAAGRPVRLDAYRADFPVLFSDAAVLAVLAAAESRLAEQFGGSAVTSASPTPPPVTALDHTRLMPVDPVTAAEAPAGRRAFPAVGHTFLGFRLVAELGTGAFGQVFLAEQVALAGRLVALKVTTRPTTEPEQLAKLRHTNIVPIYSVHAADPLQAVCMPYLGRHTLVDFIKGYQEAGPAAPSRRRSGGGAASTSMAAPTVTDVPAPAGPGSPPAAPGPLPAAPDLSHEDHVVWLMARLARGLAHAHSRHILHLDLKPANVLLADDGEPLLLDFNLAFDQTTAKRDRSGGTLPYMAPEQLEDFRDRSDARVDARTDLFALGVIFHELLTGRHPFPTPVGRPDIAQMLADRRAGPAAVRAANPRVSPAVAAVVRTLLQADPAKRYPSADALAADLDRHQQSRPLEHAANPSARERAAKWRRRNPRFGVAVVVAGLAVTAAGLGLVAARQQAAGLVRGATARASGIGDDLARLRVDLACRDDLPVRAMGQARARELLAVYALPSAGADFADHPAVRPLDPADRARLAADLAETCLLLAHADWLEARLLPAAAAGPVAASGRDWAALAGRLSPAAAPAAAAQCGAFDRLAGGTEVADDGDAPADLYLRATRRMAEGRFAAAVGPLEALTLAAPDHFAGHFQLGVCHAELGDPTRALERLLTAKALGRTDPRPCFARGLLLDQQRRTGAAEAELDEAVRRDPAHADSYKLRGIVRVGRGADAAAVADFGRALELGASPVQVRSLRAAALARLGDHAAAAADQQAAAATPPVTATDYSVRGASRVPADLAGAAADYAAAAHLDPQFTNAWLNLAHLAHDRLAQPGRARDALDRAVAAAPDSAAARAGRALLLARAGERDAAHADIATALVVSTDPAVAYRAACVYAVTSRTDPRDAQTALGFLRTALRTGYHDPAAPWTDPDLAAVRGLPEFAPMLEAARLLNRGQAGGGV